MSTENENDGKKVRMFLTPEEEATREAEEAMKIYNKREGRMSADGQMTDRAGDGPDRRQTENEGDGKKVRMFLTPEEEATREAEEAMKIYVHGNLVKAQPMHEFSWRREQGLTLPLNIASRHGFKIEYPNGEVRWWEKGEFDTRYRQVTDEERRLFVPDRDDPEVIKYIARVCHEVNRAYCAALGDESQVSWEDAPEWQKNSAIGGVLLHIYRPEAGPKASHESWAKQKVLDGWKYGPVKNPERKEHPCLVEWDELPVEQRAKDFIFAGVVKAMRKQRTDEQDTDRCATEGQTGR